MWHDWHKIAAKIRWVAMVPLLSPRITKKDLWSVSVVRFSLWCETMRSNFGRQTCRKRWTFLAGLGFWRPEFVKQWIDWLRMTGGSTKKKRNSSQSYMNMPHMLTRMSDVLPALERSERPMRTRKWGSTGEVFWGLISGAFWILWYY